MLAQGPDPQIKVAFSGSTIRLLVGMDLLRMRWSCLGQAGLQFRHGSLVLELRPFSFIRSLLEQSAKLIALFQAFRELGFRRFGNLGGGAASTNSCQAARRRVFSAWSASTTFGSTALATASRSSGDPEALADSVN